MTNYEEGIFKYLLSVWIETNISFKEKRLEFILSHKCVQKGRKK